MRIGVVGLGRVGLVAGACFAELGHEVVLVDNEAAKLETLRTGVIPVHEPFLHHLFHRNYGGRLTVCEDLVETVRASSVVFIAVETPPGKNGEADLTHVEAVACEMALACHGEYKLVVVKSTVPVCTCTCIHKVLLRNGAVEGSFDVASNPEFLRAGSAVTDFLYPERIVLGADSERGAAVLRAVYQPLSDGCYCLREDAVPQPQGAHVPTRVILVSTKSAELIKQASNAFLAMKISFINVVAAVCENVGGDIEQVCEGMGSDSRIGRRFLQPGIGCGGPGFHKDVMAFRAVACEAGYDFRLLEEVLRINEDQRQRFVRQVGNALWTLRGKQLGVLGLAFKGGTDDIRESPAIELIELLLKEGGQVVAYDPAAIERARPVFGNRVKFADSAYEAVQDADALIILTDWDEFRNLDLERLRRAMRYPIVIDGRNLYTLRQMEAHGFLYHSIGRPMVGPKARAIAFSRGAADTASDVV
jgi:UDPglucose 6-dehydrogenase